MNRAKFYDQLKNKAVEGWEEFQILPSIALAQSAHESAFGTSLLATEAHNLFGIKHKKDEQGHAYFKKTWEVIDGKRVDIVEPFKAFKTDADSFDAYYKVFHGSDWRKDFYSEVIGETDYKKASEALTGKYATDPAYKEKLIKMIEQDQLYKYDIEADAVTKPDKDVPQTEEEKEQVVDTSSSLPEPHGKPDFYINNIPVYKDFLDSKLPNYSGYFMDPKVIIVHETENFSVGANAYMHNEYLHNGAGGRSASWSFTVDDECIFWHIPLNRNGWQAGDGATGFGNRNGIGIEHCENKDGDFKTTVENGKKLIRWIRKEIGKDLPVEPHQKYSSYGKNCPSNILPIWKEYVASINNSQLEAPVTSEPKPHDDHDGDEYDGNSIVDYLISIGEDSSFANRKKLADKHNIKNYSGTALQNLELLDQLREGTSRIDDAKEKSITTLAQEVIDGVWKNFPERKTLLEAKGYNYDKVQAEVERILDGEKVVPDSYTSSIKIGDKVTASKLYVDGYVSKPARTSSVTGYVQYIDRKGKWKNPYRLVKSKGKKDWLGYARKDDLKK